MHLYGPALLGSYIGGRIAQSGADVVLVDPWGEHVNAIKQHGIQLCGT